MSSRLVYSTRPEDLQDNKPEEPETLPPEKQNLRLIPYKHLKGGKKAVEIQGFIGKKKDLEALARELKTYCGVGGSIKEGNILLQGDILPKALTYLQQKGYKAKKSGG